MNAPPTAVAGDPTGPMNAAISSATPRAVAAAKSPATDASALHMW